MLDLSSCARAQNVAALVAAGLDPGATNMLARLAAERAGGADRVDVTLLLSLGDRFGAVAVDWTLSKLASPVVVDRAGSTRTLRAYRGRRRVEFPPPIGRKLGYRFPFPEQAFFGETLGAGEADNWYAMDSDLTSRLLAAAVSLGLGRVLGSSRPRRAVARPLGRSARVPGGRDEVCALVEVRGPRGRRRAALLSSKESETTVRCALPFDVSLVEGGIPMGVWLPEQVVDAGSYLVCPGRRWDAGAGRSGGGRLAGLPGPRSPPGIAFASRCANPTGWRVDAPAASSWPRRSVQRAQTSNPTQASASACRRRHQMLERSGPGPPRTQCRDMPHPMASGVRVSAKAGSGDGADGPPGAARDHRLKALAWVARRAAIASVRRAGGEVGGR